MHEVTPTTKVDNLPMSDEGHDMLVVHLPATGQGQIENALKESGMLALSSYFIHEIYVLHSKMLYNTASWKMHLLIL